MSINHGIKSVELIRAVETLTKKYENKKIYNLELSKYFKKEFLK
jgi:putative hydrolase of HD superfamily